MVSSLCMAAIRESLLFFCPEGELLIEGFDDGVESDGAECGDVQSGADGGSTTPDGLFAPNGSAVTVDRGDPDEQGDLLS